MYVLIPELLEASRRAAPEDALESEMRSLLAKELRLFAKAEEQSGDHYRAKRFVAMAREFETNPRQTAKENKQPQPVLKKCNFSPAQPCWSMCRLPAL